MKIVNVAIDVNVVNADISKVVYLLIALMEGSFSSLLLEDPRAALLLSELVLKTNWRYEDQSVGGQLMYF